MERNRGDEMSERAPENNQWLPHSRKTMSSGAPDRGELNEGGGEAVGGGDKLISGVILSWLRREDEVGRIR